MSPHRRNLPADLDTNSDRDVVAWVCDRLSLAADTPSDSMHLQLLATLDTSGCPDARLMVLRGVSLERPALWFHADAQSRKIAQIKANPAASVVAFDPSNDLQIRLRGHAVLVTSDEELRAHWQHIRALVQHLRHDEASTPAHDLRLDALNRSDHDPWWKPDHFAVIEFRPDHLDLHVPHNGHPTSRSISLPTHHATSQSTSM